jgi:hypothetical protein
METDISILRKSGHFYFALTHDRCPNDRCPNSVASTPFEGITSL